MRYTVYSTDTGSSTPKILLTATFPEALGSSKTVLSLMLTCSVNAVVSGSEAGLISLIAHRSDAELTDRGWRVASLVAVMFPGMDIGLCATRDHERT